MRASFLIRMVFWLVMTMSMEVHAYPLWTEADPSVEALLDEEAIFRKAGFDEQASLLLGACPFHTAFASRVELLRQINRPLEPGKVGRFNEEVRHCSTQYSWSTERCTKSLCMSLLEVFELPVKRVMSQRALALKRLEDDERSREKDQDFTTVGGVLVLLFTLVAVYGERRWRGGQRS